MKRVVNVQKVPPYWQELERWIEDRRSTLFDVIEEYRGGVIVKKDEYTPLGWGITLDGVFIPNHMYGDIEFESDGMEGLFEI